MEITTFVFFSLIVILSFFIIFSQRKRLKSIELFKILKVIFQNDEESRHNNKEK